MPVHTHRKYAAELRELREKLLTLGGLVEEAIARSVRSLAERDTALARQVCEDDRRINRSEVEIDELCLRLLALHQPAASDLRFITLAMKVVTDLERIGDLAVNIAERAEELNAIPPLKPWVDIPRMAQLTQRMLKEALDAFVAADAQRARAILASDDEVDELYRKVLRELLDMMAANPAIIPQGMAVLFVAKHLERIADHVTNVAEMVIFYVEGRDVRHPKSRDIR